MVTQIILAFGLLATLFVLFLVISKATGGIDNTLYKLEYMIRKECDIKLESLEMKYKIRTADKAFEERYGSRYSSNIKNFSDDIQKAADSNE